MAVCGKFFRRVEKIGRHRAAFSLLELMTVIMIIALLAVLTFPAINMVRQRAEKIRCTGNLRNLYYGANSYVQDKGSWPQINPSLMKTNSTEYAAEWIAALEPFGIGRDVWICPTLQRNMNNPDYIKPANARTDYFATPFDEKRLTPYQWQTQPWFIERGSVHGSGNLLIFTDGRIESLDDIRKPSGS